MMMTERMVLSKLEVQKSSHLQAQRFELLEPLLRVSGLRHFGKEGHPQFCNGKSTFTNEAGEGD